jgi:hypothetical protein
MIRVAVERGHGNWSGTQQVARFSAKWITSGLARHPATIRG